MPSARNRQADVAGRCSLQLRSVVKSYRTGSERRLVLDGLTATFQGPGLVAILGPSGCGKTTLLNILGGLDRSYEGTLLVNGVPTDDFSDADWDCYRGARIGFVFQSPRLVDYLSVSENIEVARRLAAACGADEARVEEPDVQQLLASCGLSGLENALPAQLSGGQAQRASIARALAKAPDIVLADEPTGSLDQESGRQVMELLASAARERLVIVVTHDESLARAYASRIVRLTGGGTVSGDELPDDGLPSGQPDAAGLPRKRRSFPGITRLALRHAVRKKLRSAVTFAAIGLGTLFFLVMLVLSGSNQEYLERLVSSSTLDHPLVAAVKPPSASQGGAGGETSDAGEGVGVDVSGESVLQTYADGYSKPSLLSLRSFLEAGGIMDDVLDVQVSYQTELNIYKEDGTPVLRGGQSMLTDRLDVIGALGLDAKEQIDGQLSSSSLIRELVEDEDASASCYELVSGRMPENENELVLIVDSEGMMLDYVAYTLGFLEDDALVDVMMGSEDAPGPSLPIMTSPSASSSRKPRV